MCDEHLDNLPRIKTATKKVTQIFINPSEIQSFGEQYPISSKKFYDKLKSETSKLWNFITDLLKNFSNLEAINILARSDFGHFHEMVFQNIKGYMSSSLLATTFKLHVQYFEQGDIDPGDLAFECLQKLAEMNTLTPRDTRRSKSMPKSPALNNRRRLSTISLLFNDFYIF